MNKRMIIFIMERMKHIPEKVDPSNSLACILMKLWSIEVLGDERDKCG